MRSRARVFFALLLAELRYGEGKGERLPELARELLGLKVDVIVAPNDVAIDWTADWLHRECELILDDWARSEHGRPYADLGPEPQAALRELQDVATDAI